MIPKRTAKEYVKEYALIIIGAAFTAWASSSSFYPNQVLAGGLTGIAMIINMLTDLPVGVMNIIMNIPLFIAAWKRFGLGFVIGSFTGMAASSVFIDLFSLIGWEATDNVLLGTIFGGVLNGTGLGIIYRAGVTTGGVDIVVKFLRLRYAYLNFGTLMLILDVIILAAYALIFTPWRRRCTPPSPCSSSPAPSTWCSTASARARWLHHQRRERQAEKRHHQPAGPRRDAAQRRGRVYRPGLERHPLRHQKDADHPGAQDRQERGRARIPHRHRRQGRVRQRL